MLSFIWKSCFILDIQPVIIPVKPYDSNANFISNRSIPAAQTIYFDSCFRYTVFMKEFIDTLLKEHTLSRENFIRLIDARTPELSAYLFEKADAVRKKHFSNSVYIRGLIEFTNYCVNDCYYCGIRRSNREASRYRLSKEAVLSCCEEGYALGFRTFVLQGGEDRRYSDETLSDLIASIKSRFPDCAVTLSVGERSYDSYQSLFEAGADRYLLRHETADEAHYKKLHPASLSLENRKQCLWNLKEIGYQTGCGFMVGSPCQRTESIAEDLLFIHELQPEMVGIGPFIPHHDTPFKDFPKGSVELTLYLIGILRLMLPKCLIPATTALGTLDPEGREKGILAGANVCMPNLSPVSVRKKYLLYDNKICTGDESAEHLKSLSKRMAKIGFQIIKSRGDHPDKI